MTKKIEIDKETIQDAVIQSKSIRNVLLILGLNISSGGSYRVLYRLIKEYNIDTSHFTGMLWSKGTQVALKVPLEDYLSNKKKIQSWKLRNRLLREFIFPHECSVCHNTTWNDKPIPIELDHKDGNKYNNNLDNLRLICPNCHAQTHNYKSKNSKRYKEKRGLI